LAPQTEGQAQPGALSFLTAGTAASQLTIGQSGASETGAGPLETNVSFALSQVSALRELLAELRPRLAGLAQDTNLPAQEDDVAKERRAYIEVQSRRALERQGMATDAGALESLGRLVTADELAALEALADNTNNPDIGSR
jgi:kinetochore protein Mis12/MTW1